MEVGLINFNKGKHDEGYLKFYNILKWSTTEGLLHQTYHTVGTIPTLLCLTLLSTIFQLYWLKIVETDTP
jgi:hypothetical protein